MLSCRAQATQPTRPCRGLGVVVVPRAGDAAEAEVPEKSVYVAEGILGEAWAEATCGSILDRPYSFQMALLIIWLYWKLYLFAVECSSRQGSSFSSTMLRTAFKSRRATPVVEKTVADEACPTTAGFCRAMLAKPRSCGTSGCLLPSSTHTRGHELRNLRSSLCVTPLALQFRSS